MKNTVLEEPGWFNTTRLTVNLVEGCGNTDLSQCTGVQASVVNKLYPKPYFSNQLYKIYRFKFTDQILIELGEVVFPRVVG